MIQACSFGFVDKVLTRRCGLGEGVRSTIAGVFPERLECMAALGHSCQGESVREALWGPLTSTIGGIVPEDWYDMAAPKGSIHGFEAAQHAESSDSVWSSVWTCPSCTQMWGLPVCSASLVGISPSLYQNLVLLFGIARKAILSPEPLIVGR